MVAEVLDGRACADSIETSLGAELATLAESGITPHLAVIIVGNDPASHVYVGAKERACARLGIKSSKYELSGDAAWDEVTSLVEELNRNDDVDAILVQSPLPNGMDELVISELINPEKDVDGFHPHNLGRLVQGRVDGLKACFETRPAADGVPQREPQNHGSGEHDDRLQGVGYGDRLETSGGGVGRRGGGNRDD